MPIRNPLTLTLALMCCPAFALPYSITDLGSMGVRDINDLGQIVGTKPFQVLAQVAGETILTWQTGSVIYFQGTVTEIRPDALGTDNRISVGFHSISNNGDMAGTGYDLLADIGLPVSRYVALRYHAGEATIIGSGPSNGISAYGDIAYTDVYSSRYYWDRHSIAGYRPGEGRIVNDLAATKWSWESNAIAINDNGVMLGYYTTSPFDGEAGHFLFDGQSIAKLSFNDFTPVAFNNNAEFIGSTSSGIAQLWSGGAKISLGTLGGATSTALAINNRGQIVGHSTPKTDPHTQHAFLYQNGIMTDLNTLDGVAGTGWVIEQAVSINNVDQIVGVGINPAGDRVSLLLTPVPEAPTWMNMLIALGLFLLIRNPSLHRKPILRSNPIT